MVVQIWLKHLFFIHTKYEKSRQIKIIIFMKIKTLRILFHQKEKLSIFANVGNEYITIWKRIIKFSRFTKTLTKNFLYPVYRKLRFKFFKTVEYKSFVKWKVPDSLELNKLLIFWNLWGEIQKKKRRWPLKREIKVGKYMNHIRQVKR